MCNDRGVPAAVIEPCSDMGDLAKALNIPLLLRFYDLMTPLYRVLEFSSSVIVKKIISFITKIMTPLYGHTTCFDDPILQRP